jgi:hypothetical protein
MCCVSGKYGDDCTKDTTAFTGEPTCVKVVLNKSTNKEECIECPAVLSNGKCCPAN